MRPASRLALGVALAVVAPARALYAQEPAGAETLPPAVDARADDVSFDARQKELLLHGHVRLDSPPFYLSSDELQVERTRLGAEVKGEGKIAFCPCLGTPLAIGFDGATVAPPGDLFVKDPTLRVYDVPVLWLPFFWLRSPGRVGLLAPDVQYRGHDGMLLGDGVHLPWSAGDLDNGIDVRAGGYTVGGAAVDVQSHTAATLTRVRWDRIKGDDGLTLDARGGFALRQTADDQVSAAWQLDAIRGARGVLSTTDLDAAARPFDRATAETAWRGGPFSVATGARAVAVRGGGLGDVGVAGPMASVRASEAMGSAGAFDATIDGGELRGEGLAALTYARAEGGATLATRLGAVGAELSARGAGDLADDGARQGKDGAATARLELALPLVRAFDAGDSSDPVRHRFEPRVAAGVLAAHDEGVLGVLPGRGAALVSGAAWFAEGTLSNAIGRWGARSGNEIDASVGAVGDDQRAQPVARWRGATTATWIGSAADIARVFPGGGSPSGVAAIGRARIGKTDGVHVAALVAMREGTDPIAARVLTDAPLEPSTGFLAQTGWTGGARVAVPWSRAIVTAAGADADLSAPELLAARGSVELRDRCGCLVVRATGSHRLGRPGVDVALTVDFVPPR